MLSNFKLYIATEQRTYPSFDLTAVPGFVYDFGTIPVPLDGRWATSAGPATGVFDNTVDVMVGNVINQSGGYVYTTSGPPNIGNFAPPMLAYDLGGATYGCVGSGNPGAWVVLIGSTDSEITRADAAYAPISHLTASDPHGDRTYADTQLALLPASFAPLDAGKAFAADATLYVSPSGNDTNDGLSWKSAYATLSAAVNALSSGGMIEFAGSHTLSTALPQPANNTLIRGRGPKSQITFSGATPFCTLTNASKVRFEAFTLAITNSAGTGFDLNNSFRCSWRGVVVQGQHTSATGSTYRSQVGFRLRGNAGDNRVIDCDINNFGMGVYTTTIMNYLIGCDLGSNYRGIYGGDPAGTDFSSGIAMIGGTIVSNAATSSHHVFIEGSANLVWLHGAWMEGANVGVEIGNSSGGPVGFHLAGGIISATTTCLKIVNAKQPSITGVRLSADASATPTDLVVTAATAPDGYAAGIVTDMQFDIPASAFPTGWIYIGRTRMKLPTNVDGDLNLAGKQVITQQADGDIPHTIALRSTTTNHFATWTKGGSTYFDVDQFGILFTNGFRFNSNGLGAGLGIYQGNGSPASTVSAPIGSLYLRRDGGTGTTLWVKESGGSGNTGWVSK